MNKSDVFLVADIGGTKSYLAIFQHTGKIVFSKKYLNAEFDAFNQIVVSFIDEYKNRQSSSHLSRIVGSCLAVAGPIEGEICKVTNLDWTITSENMKHLLNTSNCWLINDLEAAGYYISSSEFFSQENSANPNVIKTIKFAKNKENIKKTELIQDSKIDLVKIVAGIGTGFGLAMVLQNDQISVIPTETGHTAFTPLSKEQILLQEFLLQNDIFPSIESVCSAIGILNIYKFIKNNQNSAKSNQINSIIHKSIEKSSDPTFHILEESNSNDPIILKTITLFAKILQQELYDLSLRYLPNAIYLTGGVISQIHQFLEKHFSSNNQQFRRKMDSIVDNIPIHVISNPDFAIHGCFVYLSKIQKQM